jgi:hypothetical protein
MRWKLKLDSDDGAFGQKAITGIQNFSSACLERLWLPVEENVETPVQLLRDRSRSGCDLSAKSGGMTCDLVADLAAGRSSSYSATVCF